jgi:CubicO group peptidase (beta-lactamase class C family)
LPDDAVGHNGFTGTSLWIEPRRGRIHVLLTNRVHPCVPIEDFAAVRRRFHGAATV